MRNNAMSYRNWGRLNDDGELVLMPVIFADGVPGDDEKRARGYKPVDWSMPRPGPGMYILSMRWEQDSDHIYRVPVLVERQPTVDDYNRAVEMHLASERIDRGYDTREPSLYVNSSVPRWRQDAVDWIEHVDKVMLYALDVMNHWKETGEVVPLDEFKECLPRISWSDEA